MDITLPPGYESLVLFDKEQHKGLSLRRNLPFGASLNAVFVTAPEFALACRDYPLVFVRDAAAEAYVPMIVTALSNGTNLFVDDSGHWQQDVYVPAYVRRYPFCVAEGRQQDGSVHAVICVDEKALESSDSPLFDHQGEPTSVWQGIEKLINDMEVARQQTTRFCRALDDLDLLEPFRAQAALKNGEKYNLQSMYRVDEKKLNELPADVIQEMMGRGDLGRIYLHLASLNNFARLVDRTALADARNTLQ